MTVKFIEIIEDDSGQRLDNFLMRQFRYVPKSLIYRIIRKGEVRINKKRVKPDTRVKCGDSVRIPPIKVENKKVVDLENQPNLKQIKSLETSILYEDEDLMVLNKPSGIAVHGGSGIQWGLIEALRKMRPLAKRLELVHRLDRETSGCILLAKKASVLKNLHQQVRENKLNKQYLALVKGNWDKRVSKVDLPLKKNTLKSGERMVCVDLSGKQSISFFSVEKRFDAYDLLRVRLKTGRTHQIRVHAKYQGYPIIGDDKYGDKETNKYFRKLNFKRLGLHSVVLGFEHPNKKEWMEIQAPLDKAWNELLETFA